MATEKTKGALKGPHRGRTECERRIWKQNGAGTLPNVENVEDAAKLARVHRVCASCVEARASRGPSYWIAP